MDIIGILVLVISFFFLLVVGVPVAYSIGVAGILTMLVNIDSLPALTTYAMRMASGLDSFALLAIPFFILAGNIMNSGGIALRLIDFAKVLVGRLPGGLAVVNVVANMLFGAIPRRRSARRCLCYREYYDTGDEKGRLRSEFQCRRKYLFRHYRHDDTSE